MSTPKNGQTADELFECVLTIFGVGAQRVNLKTYTNWDKLIWFKLFCASVVFFLKQNGFMLNKNMNSG